MGKERQHRWRYAAAAAAVILLAVPGKAEAAELPEAQEGSVWVEFPDAAEGGSSPFDFILDPQGLLYMTDAVRYGGGTVEEGATLLFRGTQGKYDFSRDSDRLTVTNQGTVPVTVTVTASVDGLGEVELAGSGDFAGNQDQEFYLALVDDNGNVLPLSEEGEVSFCQEVAAGTDAYSFGLTGACNPYGDWSNCFIHPVVTITWSVEPAASQASENKEGQNTSLIVPGTGQAPGMEQVPGTGTGQVPGTGTGQVPGTEQVSGNNPEQVLGTDTEQASGSGLDQASGTAEGRNPTPGGSDTATEENGTVSGNPPAHSRVDDTGAAGSEGGGVSGNEGFAG